jgi:hypothetical protein
LYVDVSNDTVFPIKPKVEILPFEKSQLTPIKDYRHFRVISQRYWRDQVFPNHVLPELAPYCPLIHVGPSGTVTLRNATQYMLALTRASGFRISEEVLCEPAMPADLFKFIVDRLQGTRLKPARTPEQGRVLALQRCRLYRANRRHRPAQQTDSILAPVREANRHLARLIVMHTATTMPPGGIIEACVRGATKETSSFLATSNRPSPIYTTNHVCNYAVVLAHQHAGKRWQRQTAYRFAAQDALVSLAAQELPQAMLALPIGFIAIGEIFSLVAVQGLAPGRNVFIAPDGRWLAGYLPAAYRSYPFKLARTGDGLQTLCVDENSGLVTEDSQGERFFDDHGHFAPAVADILHFLTQLQANLAATAGICAVLQKHQLIQRWPIKVQTEKGEKNIEGLYRVDETALNALPPPALVELRDAGALAAAYCQLLSMQHLMKLGQMM